MTDSLTAFLLGVGVTMCLWWVQQTRQHSRRLIETAAARSPRDPLRASLARAQADREAAAHAQLVDAPAVPQRYVITPAPSLPATRPDPTVVPTIPAPAVADAVPSVWIAAAQREAMRCAAIRRQYDRTVCFDIQCPSCSPRPQDQATGAITVPEVA